MESFLSKKNKVNIKNVFPRDGDVFQASGEIILRKDTNVDISCFDINFDEYFSA